VALNPLADVGTWGEDCPAVDVSVLDNAVWHSLRTGHHDFAEVAGLAARYDPDISVFAALADDRGGGWDDFAQLLGTGSGALFRPNPPATPPGWQALAEGQGHQMVLGELVATDAPEGTRTLGRRDVAEMLALVELTRPGPFCVRTVELGGYVGVFDGRTLVAMAGQRLAPPGFREISAVCTHPDFRGHGLAAGLTALVTRQILERGERPFLHHAAENHPARRVYEALGFRFHQEVTWRVLARG
jgi:ribosomal protein S18 acetylase RimI-like enzyme